MMSKAIFDKLPKNHQDIIMTVGAELEPSARGAPRTTTSRWPSLCKGRRQGHAARRRHGGKWRDIARDTAWKDYSAKSATSANLLKLANDVAA